MEETARNVAVLGAIEAYLPSVSVPNSFFNSTMDTTDEWIRARTGIANRFWVSGDVSTGDLAVRAGQRLMAQMGDPDAIDAVILCTTTPDHLCPATAPDVAARLGLVEVPAFDVSAVCSSFIYGLAVSRGFISSGQFRNVLLIGADAYSLIIDKADRSTSILFGDGAGAALIRAGRRGDPGEIIGINLGSDGRYKTAIMIPDGGVRSRISNRPNHTEDRHFRMDGRLVFDLAIRKMAESSRKVLSEVGWNTEDIDWLVAHQANQRIIRMLSDYLGVSVEKSVQCIEKYGNTSSASIPIALRDAFDNKQLRSGDKILLTAFGGGVTWGSVCLTWPQLE